MYPRRELELLAARKALLQTRIALRRWEVAAAATEVTRPIAAIDRGLATWHRISPFVKTLGVPLGLLLVRIVSRKKRGKPTGKSKFAAFMTALPLIIRGINLAKHALSAHTAHKSADLQSPVRR
jgi:hypothetical protein